MTIVFCRVPVQSAQNITKQLKCVVHLCHHKACEARIRTIVLTMRSVDALLCLIFIYIIFMLMFADGSPIYSVYIILFVRVYVSYDFHCAHNNQIVELRRAAHV